MMTHEQLAAELAALRNDIAEREKLIAFYEKYGLIPDEPNSAYVFNFAYDGMANNQLTTTRYPVQTQTVQIRKDTLFYVKSIGHAYTVVGKRLTVSQVARLTLSEMLRLQMFDYKFKIRDTGSDREWQNDWVPGSLLFTGNYNSFRMREGHALCSPGSEVSIQVDAQCFGNPTFQSQVENIASQQLQIVLAGFEVPYKEGV